MPAYNIVWRHSQVAKARDCNSLIPSSNLGVALKMDFSLERSFFVL